MLQITNPKAKRLFMPTVESPIGNMLYIPENKGLEKESYLAEVCRGLYHSLRLALLRLVNLKVDLLIFPWYIHLSMNCPPFMSTSFQVWHAHVQTEKVIIVTHNKHWLSFCKFAESTAHISVLF